MNLKDSFRVEMENKEDTVCGVSLCITFVQKAERLLLDNVVGPSAPLHVWKPLLRYYNHIDL